MGFQKNLSHLTWEEVFARQEQRAFLLPAWMQALDLVAGAHVLDLGAGPGYVSLHLAARVGPAGMVYAVDRAPDAIAYLRERLDRDSVSNVRALVVDVLHFSLESAEREQVSAVLMAMMLHHTDEPAVLVGRLAQLLPTNARAVIAEFHPDGPAISGPPHEARIAPERIEQWLRQAGLRPLDYTRQSDEHYMLTVGR